jgi:HK97 family phage major capsid protein
MGRASEGAQYLITGSQLLNYGRKAIEQASDSVRIAVVDQIRREIIPDGLASGSGRGTVPASAKKYAGLKNFRGHDAELKAYRFGMWAIAAATKQPFATKYCNDHGLPIKTAHVEKENEYGGIWVPEEVGNDLIDLREQYGVFRRNAKVVPMASDTRSDPRRKGGLTAYWSGESQEISESSRKSWDRVSLTAKKLTCIARYSNELNEDAVINIGDDLAGEIAYAFEYKVELAGFQGDGTSAYGGIVGVTTRLTSVNGVDDGGGLVSGSGNAWSELALIDFERVVGRLPEYAAVRNNCKWYCSRTFYWTVMRRLILAAGGVTAAEMMANGAITPFLGFPVEIAQVMPQTEADSQVACLFGDMQLAATLGERRQMTLAFSEHADGAFENDELLIRGTERLDINVHDVGTSTSAGPIVGLITAAS